MAAEPMLEPTALRSRADLAGQRAMVLGFARSGAALARFLADAGASVTVYDRRTAEELADAVASLEGREIELALGADPDEARQRIRAAEVLFTSPSVSPQFPTTEEWLREALQAAAAAGTPILSEVELFLRLARCRVLGVTGTKGKTTTTALIGALLTAGGVRHEVGGNIGRPLVELSGELGPDDWAVLELSELQLPTISLGVDLAVYTNITADHLDRHGTVDAYRAVKARLARLSPGATLILNADDPGCRDLAATGLGGDLRWYGLHGDAPGGGALDAALRDGWLILGDEPFLASDELRLPGRHMLANALAAALAAHLLGVAAPMLADGLRGFHGVPHRLELIAEQHGVRFVNDSQATIPVAAQAALEAFGSSRIVLIAGGSDKGLDYAEFCEAVSAHCAAAVLIGETAGRLEALIGERIPTHRARSMDDAVTIAAGLAGPGDVVLLSPAAASFDMFTDYAARGDAFRAAVLARGGTS